MKKIKAVWNKHIEKNIFQSIKEIDYYTIFRCPYCFAILEEKLLDDEDATILSAKSIHGEPFQGKIKCPICNKKFILALK